MKHVVEQASIKNYREIKNNTVLNIGGTTSFAFKFTESNEKQCKRYSWVVVVEQVSFKQYRTMKHN